MRPRYNFTFNHKYGRRSVSSPITSAARASWQRQLHYILRPSLHLTSSAYSCNASAAVISYFPNAASASRFPLAGQHAPPPKQRWLPGLYGWQDRPFVLPTPPAKPPVHEYSIQLLPAAFLLPAGCSTLMPAGTFYSTAYRLRRSLPLHRGAARHGSLQQPSFSLFF